MKIILILLAILCTVAATSPDPASTSYQQGATDRDAWETWFNGLSDPEKEGAEYWAAQRRLKAPVSCVAHRMDEPWLSACKEARSRLTPIDKMRNTDAQYWNGWNKKIIPVVRSAKAAENQKSTPASSPSNDQSGSFGIWPWVIGAFVIIVAGLVGIITHRPNLPENFTVVDTETTGLYARDRIVSLSAMRIETKNGKRTISYLHLVFNPARKNSIEALHKHGLEDSFLKRQPLFRQHALQIRTFLAHGGLLVSHNAEYDMKFINRELERADEPPLTNDTYCTMLESRTRWPNQPANLNYVAERIGLFRKIRTHSSLEDVWLAANVFLFMHKQPHNLALPKMEFSNLVGV